MSSTDWRDQQIGVGVTRCPSDHENLRATIAPDAHTENCQDTAFRERLARRHQEEQELYNRLAG